MKKILKIFLLVMISTFAIMTTNAEAVKDTLSVNSYTISKEPLPFPNSENNDYANFHVKKDANGKYIFCIHYAKKPPVSSISYTKGSVVSDNGMNYILNKAYTASSDEEFFKYQTALWVYMVENNLMDGTHNDIDKFIASINSSSNSLAKEIRSIATTAKTASKNDTSNPTISVDDSNVTFTLSGDYYVSSKIKVNSSTGSYDARLTNNNDIATLEKANDGFIIKVKASSVSSLKTTINFTVDNYKENYVSYYYTPSNTSYQKVAATYKQQLSANDAGSVVLTTTSKAGIIKVDAESSETLEGAVLQVLNSNGKIVDEWTTTKEVHEIKDLPEGTYTVKEVKAPDGYIKSNEEVIFKIDANGNLLDASGNKLDKVTFKNIKQEKGGVCVSKQDITNGKEIEGATLVIKDYDGNVVHKWVSEEGKSECIELEPGIYTLTEINQPDGYILSTETITFTVKDDGSITQVVMYNTPDTKEVIVEDTASYKTITSTVVGLGVIGLGLGLLFKKNKRLV